ncbi:hypothetical protein WMY93_017703 [Mugilogobius chulae]|uniref:Uncharacterized protein n=1 Tax=Mugilogobius chulae TaxID=88201 RepID=A0AAW0P0H5_9GOBI
MGETLWLLNITLEDAGTYETVVRTPHKCYRQQTKLVVDEPVCPCGRPRTAGQILAKKVTDRLSCPLTDYTKKLSHYGVSYNITWYKGCERIEPDQGRFHYWGMYLKVEQVESEDEGSYTCTLTFNLGGVEGSVSETIDAEVNGDYYLLPQVREPANDVVKAEVGTNLTKRCLVFVPCEGNPLLDVDLYWMLPDSFITHDPLERVYSTHKRIVERQEEGVWMDMWLIFSKLKEEDFNLNYTCVAVSGRGSPECYFTLLHTEPNLLLPICLALGFCLLLFILCASVYHLFKVDLVLWMRETFSGLYRSTASDGKLFDAYVAFPQSCAAGWADEVERFALHTLPQVLEEACGYALFIPGRDCLPGEALIDSVEENIQASRRILLLYTASTFSKKYCSNNNTLLSRPTTNHTDANCQVNKSMDQLDTCKDQLKGSKDHFISSKDQLNSSKDQLNSSKDQLNSSKNLHNTMLNNLNISKDHFHLNTSKDNILINKNLSSKKEQISISLNHLNSSKNHLCQNTSKDHLHLNTSLDQITTNNNTERPMNTRKEQISISLNHLNTTMNSTKEHLTTTKVHFSPGQDLHSEKEEMCGHARTQLECVAAMHRALLERSLKVILVELEELGPSDVEQLPESVRHLRQTQGAVCWWKTQRRARTRWRTVCMRRTEDTEDIETPLSSCVSPNCRFWKEVRYRMPV